MNHTHHIKTCRRSWLTHVDHCEHCQDHLTAYDIGFCETGQLFFDEWLAAILANPSCEHLEAKEVQGCTKTTTP